MLRVHDDGLVYTVISVNDREILPFCEDFISRNFAYAKFRENKTLAKTSEFSVVEQTYQGGTWKIS